MAPCCRIYKIIISYPGAEINKIEKYSMLQFVDESDGEVRVYRVFENILEKRQYQTERNDIAFCFCYAAFAMGIGEAPVSF